MKKYFLLFVILLCLVSLIIDTFNAYLAAVNHNLGRLCVNICLIGMMLLCIKLNIATYKRIKDKELKK